MKQHIHYKNSSNISVCLNLTYKVSFSSHNCCDILFTKLTKLYISMVSTATNPSTYIVQYNNHLKVDVDKMLKKHYSSGKKFKYRFIMTV